jgi:hypothetical protein
MNPQQTEETSQVEQLTPQQPVLIEVKWNIPAWIMRDPGPQVEVSDDEFEEEGT